MHHPNKSFFFTSAAVNSFYNNCPLNNVFQIIKNKYIYLVTDLKPLINRTVINYDVLNDNVIF